MNRHRYGMSRECTPGGQAGSTRRQVCSERVFACPALPRVFLCSPRQPPLLPHCPPPAGTACVTPSPPTSEATTRVGGRAVVCLTFCMCLPAGSAGRLLHDYRKQASPACLCCSARPRRCALPPTPHNRAPPAGPGSHADSGADSGDDGQHETRAERAAKRAAQRHEPGAVQVQGGRAGGQRAGEPSACCNGLLARACMRHCVPTLHPCFHCHTLHTWRRKLAHDYLSPLPLLMRHPTLSLPQTTRRSRVSSTPS